MGFRGVVFSDDIGMAAAFSAGGVKARIDVHLDAGCDVVLVCHPELVDESLAAVQGRRLNTIALTGLLGRGAMGWDGPLADARHAQPGLGSIACVRPDWPTSLALPTSSTNAPDHSPRSEAWPNIERTSSGER